MPRSQSEIDLLTPIATQIGLTVVEWNDLYESMGLLFSRIIHPGLAFSTIALAIWHSIPSDRTQRDMLAASVMARFDDEERPDDVKQFPKAKADIDWLLKKANNLADPRNNAIHAPLTFRLNKTDASIPEAVVAATFFDHPRALKLEGKDLLVEFRWAAAYAEQLKLFARNLDAAITFGDAVHPWPERPILPDRDQFRSDKG